MLSAVLAIVNLSVCLSVCPSVRHTLALCQNDSSYDQGVFTVGLPHDDFIVSSWLTLARNSKGNLGSEDAE